MAEDRNQDNPDAMDRSKDENLVGRSEDDFEDLEDLEEEEEEAEGSDIREK